MSKTNTLYVVGAGRYVSTMTKSARSNNDNKNTNNARRIINHKIIESVPRDLEVSNTDIGYVLGLMPYLIYRKFSFDILNKS